MTPFSTQQHECIIRALHLLFSHGFDVFVPRRQSWECRDLSKCGQSCLSVLQILMGVWDCVKDGTSPTLDALSSYKFPV